MNTVSARPSTLRHGGPAAWTLRHPWTSAVAALFGAVLAGVLIGILFSMLSTGADPATQHRAGGHAIATVAAVQHAAMATIATATGGEIATRSHIHGGHSPARAGFAVGRTSGAGSGFITIDAGTRSPARGGFPGRSLGAGD